ncbi:hypothetical protein DFJ74DRAFT_430942 [Hyaloraphidium curvatum]|nr:hypothetical protein DFJ74DRAFT_430942 [Hyaloraphidium curvatum]
MRCVSGDVSQLPPPTRPPKFFIGNISRENSASSSSLHSPSIPQTAADNPLHDLDGDHDLLADFPPKPAEDLLSSSLASSSETLWSPLQDTPWDPFAGNLFPGMLLGPLQTAEPEPLPPDSALAADLWLLPPAGSQPGIPFLPPLPTLNPLEGELAPLSTGGPRKRCRRRAMRSAVCRRPTPETPVDLVQQVLLAQLASLFQPNISLAMPGSGSEHGDAVSQG